MSYQFSVLTALSSNSFNRTPQRQKLAQKNTTRRLQVTAISLASLLFLSLSFSLTHRLVLHSQPFEQVHELLVCVLLRHHLVQDVDLIANGDQLQLPA